MCSVGRRCSQFEQSQANGPFSMSPGWTICIIRAILLEQVLRAQFPFEFIFRGKFCDHNWVVNSIGRSNQVASPSCFDRSGTTHDVI